jgi:hypothetical protein
VNDSDFYPVDEAAKILKLTPGRIRQMLRKGEMEGVSPEDSGGGGWKIPMRVVHDRDRPARVERPPGPPDRHYRCLPFRSHHLPRVTSLAALDGLQDGRDGPTS